MSNLTHYNTLPRYKGFEAKFEFDPVAKILHGRVLGTRSIINFQSDTLETVEQEFHASVDDYLAFCEERGVPRDKSYSGHIAFRTTPEIHRRIAYAVAQKSDCSLSKWIERACVNQLQVESMAAASVSPMLGQRVGRVPLDALTTHHVRVFSSINALRTRKKSTSRRHWLPLS